MLRRDCANAQSRQNLRSSHLKSIEVEEYIVVCANISPRALHESCANTLLRLISHIHECDKYHYHIGSS